MLQAQAVPLLVCAQSPEVYIVKGGMYSVSALKSVEYTTAFFHSRPAVLLCCLPPLLKCW